MPVDNTRNEENVFSPEKYITSEHFEFKSICIAGQQQAHYQQQQLNLQQQPQLNAFPQQNQQQAAGFNQQNLIQRPAGQQNVQQFNQVPIMQQKQPGRPLNYCMF